MEKSIIIKEDGKSNHTIEINGFNVWETLGILRFYEKDVWLQIEKNYDTQRKLQKQKRDSVVPPKENTK